MTKRLHDCVCTNGSTWLKALGCYVQDAEGLYVHNAGGLICR